MTHADSDAKTQPDRRATAPVSMGIAGALAAAVLLGTGTPAGAAGVETLRFEPPQGWQQVHQVQREGLLVRHLVAPGQSAATWHDMITVQVLRVARQPTLNSLYARALGGYQANCPNARSGGLQSGESNGYPTGFWILGCPKNTQTGQGETAFFKATLGEQAVYVLQRVWRTDPFEAGGEAAIDAAARSTAIDMLKGAQVCIEGSADHPCR